MTWIGLTAQQWNSGTNWSTGSVPTASQDVYIPISGTGALDARIGSTTAAVANNIFIGGTAGTTSLQLRTDTVNSLTVGGNITIAPDAGAGQLVLGTGAGGSATLTIAGGTGSILDGGGAGASRILVYGHMGTLGLATVTVDELNINQNSSGSLTIGSGQTYTVGTARVGSASANVTDALTVNGTLVATTFNPGATAASGTNDATVTLNTGALVRAVTIRRAGTQATTFTWNGGTIQNSSGGNLTLDATAGTQIISLASAGTRTFDADSGRTITVASTTLLADKSGENGSLTKSGAGTLIFSGSNTYTGATTLSAGTLRLSNQNAIQNSTLAMNGGSMAFDSSVSGNAFTAGGLSGTSSGAGFDIALQNNAGTPAAITLTVGGNNASTTYAGVLSAAGGLTKSGSGVLTLTGANTFSGATTVSSGSLQIGSGGTTGAIGSTSGVSVAGGATLAFNRSDNYGGNFTRTITGSGGAVLSSGTLTLQNTGNTFSGGIAVNGGVLKSLGNSAGNTITVNNGGTFGMAGTDTWGAATTATTPAITINAGGNMTTDGQFNSLRNLTLAGGTVTLNGGLGPSTGALTLGGTVTASGPVASTIVVTTGSVNFIRLGRQGTFEATEFNVSDPAGSLLAGAVLDNNFGAISGLTKTGAGTLLLTGSNVYTGATTVSAGRLLVNGTNAGSGGTTVAANALLGGSGRINGLVTVSGTLSPGNSPGILTLSQLVLTSTATTLMEIDGLTRGSQYDGIDLTTAGGLTYAGALSIAFGLGSAVADNTTFDLFNFSGTPTGDFASVISTGGVYAGTWSQVSSGTWSLQSGAQTLTFSAATGDVIIVPEPGTLAMLAGAGFAAAVALARRRK